MRRGQAIAGSIAAIALGALLALAGSEGGAKLAGAPVFLLCAALAFAINWVAFVPAYRARTEHFYDLTGSLTYLTVTAFALVASGRPDARGVLVAVLVAAWAIRLGTFLFRRVRQTGRDGRFDRIKTDPWRFLLSWTLQGLWVLVTLAAALAIITGPDRRSLGWVGLFGAALWIAGFAIEVIADRQKAAFRADPANEGRFITTGLWAWARHPNYFGEIVLWSGIAVIATPVLDGWRWVTLISPVFVTVLLTRISGIPLLQARAERRWGDDPAYRDYVRTTPVLIPRPPRGRSVA